MDVDEIFRPHEIIPNLWLGDAHEAELARQCGKFDKIIDVRNFFFGFPLNPDKHGFISAMLLDAFAYEINSLLKAGMKIFLHCHAGMERSPLVVAWYLVLYGPFPDLESAYRFVIDKHPITRRRGHWVSWAERDKRGMFGKKK